MIDELTDVKKYLAGEGLSHDIEYRICLLLAKWFYQNGAGTREEIREQLKDWAKENEFFITVAMNPLIDKVISENMRLQGIRPVPVSSHETELIADRFDSYGERITALAVLCYAKVYADRDGIFKLSISSLSKWLCMEQRTVRNHLKTLCSFGFIKQKEAGGISSWYNSVVVSALHKYRLEFTPDEDGDYQLVHNDINKLYDNIYAAGKWHEIPGYSDYWINDEKQVRVLERYVGGKHYPSRILKPTFSASGKKYVYIKEESGKQRKFPLDKLYEIATVK